MAGGTVNGGVEADWGSVFDGIKENTKESGVVISDDIELDKAVADWHQNKKEHLIRTDKRYLELKEDSKPQTEEITVNGDEVSIKQVEPIGIEEKEKRREYLRKIEQARQDEVDRIKEFHQKPWEKSKWERRTRPLGVPDADWQEAKLIDLYNYDPKKDSDNWTNMPKELTDEELNNADDSERKKIKEVDKYLRKDFYNDLYFACWMDAVESKTTQARERLSKVGVDLNSFLDNLSNEEALKIKSDIVKAREGKPNKEEEYPPDIQDARNRLVSRFVTLIEDNLKKNEKGDVENKPKISLEELDSLGKFEDGLSPLERRDEHNDKLNRMYKLAPSEEMGDEIVKNYFHAVDCLLVKDANYPEFPDKETARNFLKEYFGYKSEEGFDREPLLDIYKKHTIDYYWSNLGIENGPGLLSLAEKGFNSEVFYNNALKRKIVDDLVSYVSGEINGLVDKRLINLGYNLEEIGKHKELEEAIRTYKSGTPEGRFVNDLEAYDYIIKNWEVEEKKNRLYRSEYLHTDNFLNDLRDLYPTIDKADKEKEKAVERKFSTIGIKVLRYDGKKKDYIGGRKLIAGIEDFFGQPVKKYPTNWSRTEGYLGASGIGSPEMENVRIRYRSEKNLDTPKTSEVKKATGTEKLAEQSLREESELNFKEAIKPTNPIERLRLLADPEKWDNMMAVIETMDEAKKKKYRLSLRIIMYQLEHPEERPKTAGRWDSLYLPFLKQIGVDVPVGV